MPHYYRGNVRVPFEPLPDLLAISVRPNMSEDEEEELAGFARRLGPPLLRVSPAIHADLVRVFGLPDSLGGLSAREVQQRLSEHQNVRHVGPVLRLTDNSLSFLTDEVIVKFSGHVQLAAVLETAHANQFDVVQSIPYAANAYLFRWRRPASIDLLDACNALRETDLVEIAEPNLVTTVVDFSAPNDHLYQDQGHHRLIRSEEAWALESGKDYTVISIFDNGCDIDHPDLVNPPSAGWVKVTDPYDCVTGNSDPLGGTHGTKCCGIAAAVWDNEQGIAGVAPGCRLMPVRRVIGGTEKEYADAYTRIAGFDPQSHPLERVGPGADVISNSFGEEALAAPSVIRWAFELMTTYGRNGRGCVVLFAVGNADLPDPAIDFTTVRSWASSDRTIAVASSTIPPEGDQEVRATDSYWGPELDVCAPGGGVDEAGTMSTSNVGKGDTYGVPDPGPDDTKDYDRFRRTSCACAQVAGVVGLVLSKNPNLTWIGVRDCLRETAKKIDPQGTDQYGQWVNGFNQSYGYGRVDAFEAVKRAAAPRDSDIVVRDNLADTGLVPAPGTFWLSPDVWVRNRRPAIDGAAAHPGGYDENPPHENPVAGQDNWVYVRCKNVGSEPSSEFYIRAYISQYPGLEFVYPEDFIPVRPHKNPFGLFVPHTHLINEIHHPGLQPGKIETIEMEWAAHLVPLQEVELDGVTVAWHPCLLVEISPHDGPPPSGVHVWDNNNLAQRNISIVPVSPGESFATAVIAGNRCSPSGELELLIYRRKVSSDVRLYVCPVDPMSMRFVLRFADGQERGRWRRTYEKWRDNHEPEWPKAMEEPRWSYLRDLLAKRHASWAELESGQVQGREVTWLPQQHQVSVPLLLHRRRLPLIVGGVVGEGATPGRHDVELSQVNPDGRVTGYYSLRIDVGT
jgi:subtilisin family serine protease